MKKIQLTKEDIEEILTKYRTSLREIEKLTGISRSTLKKNILKYDLIHLLISDSELKSIQHKKAKDSFSKNILENQENFNKMIEKRKDTATKKYGSWSEMYKKNLENSKKTNIKKYGADNPMKNSEICQYSKKQCLKKYGTENAGWTEISKEKIIRTNLERYGKEFHLSKYKYTSNFSFSKIANDKELLKEFLSSLPEKPTLKQLSEMFKIDYTSVQKKIKKMKLEKYISFLSGKSYFELEILEFIKTFATFEILERNRNILNGLELDIYIPEKRIALEINGGFWHSSEFKEKQYHQKKSIACEKMNIRLIHIIDSQWKYQKDIIKSIIKNALGFTDRKLYARNCIIREISSKDCGLFLNENHLQGFAPSRYYYGLFYKDELVQVMTFNNSFKTKGYDSELTRNAIKLNTNIIGGTEKLFSYHIKSTKPKSIISYVDFNIFNGISYKKLSFEEKHLTKPNLIWIMNGRNFYRSPSRHKEFSELRAAGKAVKYFGSGLKVFEWNNKI